MGRSIGTVARPNFADVRTRNLEQSRKIRRRAKYNSSGGPLRRAPVEVAGFRGGFNQSDNPFSLRLMGINGVDVTIICAHRHYLYPTRAIPKIGRSNASDER